MTSCSVVGPDSSHPGQEAEAAQLRLLEGDDVAEPLRLALATLGRQPAGWTLQQVHHRPGAGATGIYQVQSKAESGEVTTDFLCVSTAQLAADTPATVQLKGPDRTTLTVWLHPNDPLLPGLPWACDATKVGMALFPGGEPTGPSAGPAPTMATVSYRPLRRAVLTADLDGQRRYLKVLRDGQSAQLAARHRMLTAAGIPAPSLIDVPAPEVLAMHPAAGTPLAEDLMRNGAHALSPQTLVELLRRLPIEAMQLPERPAWATRVRDYAKGATAVLPAEATRISELAERVHGLVASCPAGPKVPSHGDFYEGNLLVSGPQVSGLLDVDALGPGHLVDDLACFIGHLAVLPALDARYHHVPAALHRFLAVFDDEVHPAALRARAAGVALTLVAGAKHRATAEDPSSWRTDALRRLSIAETLANEALTLER